MSLSKFFGSQEDGYTLSWPGNADGFPVRSLNGEQFFLKQAETEEIPTVYDGKVKVFDLSNPADLEHYQTVLDKHANGWYRITSKRDVYDNDTKNWRILLEWVQGYGQLPTGQTPFGTMPLEF